jgi:hypothetical protein
MVKLLTDKWSNKDKPQKATVDDVKMLQKLTEGIK